MGSCKKKIAVLERRVQELLQELAGLADENCTLQSKAETLRDLLLQRNALVKVLERVEAATAAAAAAADAAASSRAWHQQHEQQQRQLLAGAGQAEHLLQQLPMEHPMHAALTTIDQQLYESVKALTPATAADFWVDKVKDVALLWHLFQRDPAAIQPALAALTAECMSWCLAVHIFNPRIMYALHDYNLVTRRYEKFDTASVKASLAAGTLTPDQLKHIQSLLSIVQPRLEQLEQEKQQLLAEIERLDEQCSAVHPQQTDGAPVPAGQAAAGAWAAPHTGGCSSTTSSSSTSTSSSASDSSCGDKPPGTVQLLQQREELLQRLDRNYTAWRVTTQMRGQWLTVQLTAQQAAKGMLAAFPYMPHGAPVFDATRSKGATVASQQPSEAEAAPMSTQGPSSP